MKLPKLKFKNRRGMARNVVDIGIAAVIIGVIAFVAAFIVGELYNALPSSITGLTFVSSIISAINSLGPLFSILIIVLLILAFVVLIFMLMTVSGGGGGGAVAGA